MYFLLKTLISAVLIATVSELSKRNALFGGLLASLPLTTVLALIWLYVETRSPQKAAELSMSVFWLVLPSLAFFPVFAALITKARWSFSASMTAGLGIMLTLYGLALSLLKWRR